ncbi:actin-related protein 2/3 complex subunit 5-C-like isoform X2 [Gordionus sp. m RMFG-2023]|uniref:actin-related protein 2/3 complex subunit 5-C-like isoform X2 n=1 Tax=Gordionus sp. m RMFG-2023 TaxID=3053472 RepID=UPI0031FC878B
MPAKTVLMAQQSQFRKLDIDDTVIDNFLTDEPNTEGLKKVFNENDLKHLLQSGRNIEALRFILDYAPTGVKDVHSREKIFKNVMQTVYSFKSGDINSAINNLTKDNLDTLMKYIYKGFEYPEDF